MILYIYIYIQVQFYILMYIKFFPLNLNIDFTIINVVFVSCLRVMSNIVSPILEP